MQKDVEQNVYKLYEISNFPFLLSKFKKHLPNILRYLLEPAQQQARLEKSKHNKSTPQYKNTHPWPLTKTPS